MKKDIKEVFGEILREIRTEKNLSQQQLADFTGMDRAFISELERGILQPSLDTLFKLAHQLKIKPGELVNQVEKRLKS